MNVFTQDAGVSQGRVACVTDGFQRFVYELGHQQLADRQVATGDYHEVSQTFVMQVGSRFIIPSIVVTAPSVLPTRGMWEVSAWLNGAKMCSRIVRRSRTPVKLADWRVSLAGANPPPATNTIAFRLALV